MKNNRNQQLKKALRLLKFRFSKNAEFDFYEACLVYRWEVVNHD